MKKNEKKLSETLDKLNYHPPRLTVLQIMGILIILGILLTWMVHS